MKNWAWAPWAWAHMGQSPITDNSGKTFSKDGPMF